MTGDVPGQHEAALRQLRDYRQALTVARDAVTEELQALPLMVQLNDLTDRLGRVDAAIAELTRGPGRRPGGYGYRSGSLAWAREYVGQAPPGQDITAADLAVVFEARGWVQRSDVTVRGAAAKALGILCRDEGLITRRRHGTYRKAPQDPGVP